MFRRSVWHLAVALSVTLAWPIGSPALWPAHLHAQTTKTAKFTTASVTRSDGFVNPYPTVENGRFLWRAAPLVLAITYAYEVTSPTLIGQIPLEPFYDIDATFPASATTSEVRGMLRVLLVDRFALRAHTERRTMPIFRLVQDVGGHKLRAASRAPTADGRPLQRGRIASFSVRGEWHFVGPQVTVREIADGLANLLRDRPVIDATGITGRFDVDIVQKATNSESFLADVPRQLGLKLEPATSSVEVLIVDGHKMP
jgi:uncharacterized protein (TIGR03435 family)